MSLGPGTAVVLHLGQPREQVFGVILSVDTSGVLIRGIAIGSVDDWLRQVAVEQGDPEMPQGHLGLTQTFFPMHRVERISFDEASHGLPSIAERFRDRLGRDLVDWVAETHRDGLPER